MPLASSVKIKPEQLQAFMYLRMLSHPASVPPLPTLCGGPGSRATVMTIEPGMWPAEHLQDMTPFGKTQISIGDAVLSFDLNAKGFPSSWRRQWSSLWAALTKIAGCQLDVRHFPKHFTDSVLLSEWCILIVPVSEERKLKYREVDSLAWDHVGGKWLKEFEARDNQTPEFLLPEMPSCYLEGMGLKG